MPQDDLINKWKAFGWNVFTADGHDDISLKKTFKKINFRIAGKPNVILARTTKGKGVSFMEGHGQWHHKIPNLEEQKLLFE